MGFLGGVTHIGVSIGSNSVKIAEIKRSGKSYSLIHFGVAQLADEAVVNREIANHMAVVDAIAGLVSQLKIRGRHVSTSISGASVIVKKILFDQTPDRELEDAIHWEAEQYVPFDINECVFDFEVVNRNGPQGKMEIILVASKKAIVDSYQAAIKDSGLHASVVDLDMFALQNAYEVNYPVETPCALVDIGAASLKFGVAMDRQLVFTRDSAVGGRMLTAEIQKHLNITYQEAELLKIDGNVQGQLPQEVADLMHVMGENLASEIKRSLDFYAASNSGPPAGYVLLAGGSARLPNLPKMVEDVVGLPVQLLNPFNTINYDAKIFSPEYVEAISSIAAVPIGLALRGFA